MPEAKDTDLWAYGLVVDVFGKRDGKDVKVKLWNSHPQQEEWGGRAAYYKNIAIPFFALHSDNCREQPIFGQFLLIGR